MPSRALRPCAHPGCPELVKSGVRFCVNHHEANDSSKQYDRTSRPDYHAWYSQKRWKKARLLFLHNNPLCAECKRSGILKPARIVDHVLPHKGDYGKFWDASNWESLCKPCHDRKTAKEDGGFGNRSNNSRSIT